MKSIDETLAILSYTGLNPGCSLKDINRYILREFNLEKTTSAIYRAFNELKRNGYIKNDSHFDSKFVLTRKGWNFIAFYMNVAPRKLIPCRNTDLAIYIRIELLKRVYLPKNRYYLGVGT
jgi:hypothetical protein